MSKRSSLSQGIGLAGKITRNNLERVGAFIDSVNAKTGKPRQFKAVDLEAQSDKKDLLREQTLKASQQLLWPRFANYGKYAKKVVPDSVFQQVVDGAFAQVAKLAATWSQLDLPEEQRLAGVKGMDDSQRYALATDIANQNRALATLGGVTGLAGLPGMLADTLWLLLVSLRTVYQMAAVYDQPLTGKQGVRIAYEMLSNADLSKMQEKQALLAGIGVAKGLLDNANQQGLRNELKNVGVQNQSIGYYAEQVDKIAEQFNLDLDQINLGWLTKFLPVTAVAIGMHYNSHLIEEVIGVAQATFAPDPKLANRLLASPDALDASKDGSKKNDTKDKTQNDNSKSDKSDAAKVDADKSDQGSDQGGDVDKAKQDNANKDQAKKKEASEDSQSEDKKTANNNAASNKADKALAGKKAEDKSAKKDKSDDQDGGKDI